MLTTEKIITFERLKDLRRVHPNKRLIQCHGVFDVLHAGHLAYFEAARRHGDLLIVTITSDEFVNKGPGRPYFNSTVRAQMIAALEIVNYVCISNHQTAVPSIEALRPQAYVKGPDYRNKDKDLTGGIYAEERAVQAGGGELIFTSDETLSSSTLINNFFPQWTDEQSANLKQVKAAGGLEEIAATLEKVSQQNLLVCGEPIIDTYVFCKAQSISSKSPTISAQFDYEENYAGGSLAIVNHMVDFCKSTTLQISHGGENHFRDLLKSSLDPRINLNDLVLDQTPTPRKTRYIEKERSQRILELTNLRTDQWAHHSSDAFSQLLLENNKKADCTLIADFGHGLFEGDVLGRMSDLTGFVGLNVQTNSSNYGFNPFTKHKRYNYLTMDLQEARIAYHDRSSPHQALVSRIYRDITEKYGSDRCLGVTLGHNGSYFFIGNEEPIKTAAFADTVVDPIGAGDAYFAMTSLLVKVGCKPELVTFIGNVFAGLKTRIIGNKSPVSKSQLVRAVTSILK